MTWTPLVVALTPLVAAQEDPLATGSILRYFGVAAPLVGFALWTNRRESARGDRWEGRYVALTVKMQDEVIPLLGQAQALLDRQGEVIAEYGRAPKPDPALLAEAERALRHQIDRADGR